MRTRRLKREVGRLLSASIHDTVRIEEATDTKKKRHRIASTLTNTQPLPAQVRFRNIAALVWLEPSSSPVLKRARERRHRRALRRHGGAGDGLHFTHPAPKLSSTALGVRKPDPTADPMVRRIFDRHQEHQQHTCIFAARCTGTRISLSSFPFGCRGAPTNISCCDGETPT